MVTAAPIASLASVADPHALISRHLAATFTTLLSGADTTHADDDSWVRLFTGTPHPLGNFSVTSAGVEAATLETVMKPMHDAGVPTSVVVTASAISTDLHGWFDDHGYVAAPLPAMALDIDALPATGLPDGYTFRRVESGDDAQAWCDALAVGYEIPRDVAAVFSPVRLPVEPAPDAPVQFFEVRCGDDIVATSLVHLRERVAGIYCVATDPAQRGRGIGAHATAEALRAVRRIGYRVGVLQASPMGHPVYRRIGFADHGVVDMFVRLPG